MRFEGLTALSTVEGPCPHVLGKQRHRARRGARPYNTQRHRAHYGVPPQFPFATQRSTGLGMCRRLASLKTWRPAFPLPVGEGQGEGPTVAPEPQSPAHRVERQERQERTTTKSLSTSCPRLPAGRPTTRPAGKLCAVRDPGGWDHPCKNEQARAGGRPRRVLPIAYTVPRGPVSDLDRPDRKKHGMSVTDVRPGRSRIRYGSEPGRNQTATEPSRAIKARANPTPVRNRPQRHFRRATVPRGRLRRTRWSLPAGCVAGASLRTEDILLSCGERAG